MKTHIETLRHWDTETPRNVMQSAQCMYACICKSEKRPMLENDDIKKQDRTSTQRNRVSAFEVDELQKEIARLRSN
jgi:hypothetical protein